MFADDKTTYQDHILPLVEANCSKCHTADKKKAPQALQDLVDAGYFRQLPIDPITNSNSTWETAADTAVASPEQTEFELSRFGETRRY